MDRLVRVLGSWLTSKEYIESEEPKHRVWATPVWSYSSEDMLLRQTLQEIAITDGPKGVGVVPAAARAIKQLDCDLIVTRNARGVLSIVLETPHGNLVVYWDVNAVYHFSQLHQSVWLHVLPNGLAGTGIFVGIASILRKLATWLEAR